MAQLKQKSIEQYFADYNISDPDQKAKILPEITQLIYDRNVYVVQAEKEDDEYKRQQIVNDAIELDKTINEIIKEFQEKSK